MTGYYAMCILHGIIPLPANPACLYAADEAAARLGKETGHPERVAALAIDVSDPKSADAAAAVLKRDFAGKLGGLINNAAVRSVPVVVV